MSRDVKFDTVYGGSSAAAENIAEESPSSNVKNNITDLGHLFLVNSRYDKFVITIKENRTWNV